MALAPARVQVGRRRTRLVWVGLVVLVLVAAVMLALVRRGTSNTSEAQIAGSGVAATEARPLPPFTGVTLAVGANVVIHPSNAAVAVVRTDDNLVGRITTRVRDGVLTVGSVGHFTTKTPLTVAIGTPELVAATVNRGGSVRLQNLAGKRLTVTLSGLGGSVRASGAVEQLEVTLQTFGDAQLRALAAKDVHAVLSGSGQITVTATRKLDATMSGSGSIIYYGNPPQVHKTVLGSGSVTPG